MSESIEEVWERRQALVSERWTGTSGQTSEQKEMSRQQAITATKVGFTTSLPKIEDWGRALALAVLEEVRGGCDSSACGSPQSDGSTWHCGPCTVRRRIEELP